jgi:hypothetical protein
MKNPLGADRSQSGLGFALAAFIKRPQAEAQIGAMKWYEIFYILSTGS